MFDAEKKNKNNKPKNQKVIIRQIQSIDLSTRKYSKRKENKDLSSGQTKPQQKA